MDRAAGTDTGHACATVESFEGPPMDGEGPRLGAGRDGVRGKRSRGLLVSVPDGTGGGARRTMSAPGHAVLTGACARPPAETLHRWPAIA
ncbi:hypothetical protein B4N89_46265 [Embleya scabrispora]|uniref:Uncharacterized protein n=1 Tax=Embleya scabrispora TaxID=159449 RepID=A0A1T3NID1_9ACTN|nr:hypothetical protein B4N89_44910 [Embleya scabrispora]OPC76880.1 hypothetical protein B4N89_46265 [Embleya scabrispora]